MITAFEIWRASWPLGWRWVVRGIEYTRCLEYPLVLDAAGIEAGQRVLDVGVAPFSLNALYVAAKMGCELHCIDIDPYIERLGDHLRRLVPAPARWSVSRQDARRMEYPDGHFDRVMAVSSLEHIPDEGDRDAVREIARVLRPGGRAVISVPYGMAFRNETADESRTHAFLPEMSWRELFRGRTGRQVFFQRRYDDAALAGRLLSVPGLRLVGRRFFGEPRVPFSRVWAARPPWLKAMTNWCAPMLAQLFLRELGEHERSHAEAVVLVLERERTP